MPTPSAPDMAAAGTEGGDGDADAAAAERRRKRKSRWEAEEQAIVIAAPLVLGGSIVARFPKEIILTGGLRVSHLSHKGLLGFGESVGDLRAMMIPCLFKEHPKHHDIPASHQLPMIVKQ